MEQLSKQENKIAHLISQGFIEKEIAEKLYVTKSTVHTHSRNIRKKIGARNIADITRTYILSLPNPADILRVLGVAFFLSLQATIMFTNNDIELRRARTVRVSIVVRVKQKDN